MTTVVVVRRGDRDADGNHPAGPPARIPLSGTWRSAPRSVRNWSQQIPDQGRDGSREELDLYGDDPNADVRPTDQIEVDGILFEVDGPPARWGTAGCVVAMWRSLG